MNIPVKSLLSNKVIREQRVGTISLGEEWGTDRSHSLEIELPGPIALDH